MPSPFSTAREAWIAAGAAALGDTLPRLGDAARRAWAAALLAMLDDASPLPAVADLSNAVLTLLRERARGTAALDTPDDSSVAAARWLTHDAPRLVAMFSEGAAAPHTSLEPGAAWLPVQQCAPAAGGAAAACYWRVLTAEDGGGAASAFVYTAADLARWFAAHPHTAPHHGCHGVAAPRVVGVRRVLLGGAGVTPAEAPPSPLLGLDLALRGLQAHAWFSPPHRDRRASVPRVPRAPWAADDDLVDEETARALLMYDDLVAMEAADVDARVRSWQADAAAIAS